MKLRIFDVQREAGFRINLVDLLFIALLSTLSWLIYNTVGTYYAFYLLPLYVGITFFLFCNVFRLPRKLELLWIVCFLMISVLSYWWLKEQWFFYAAGSAAIIQAVLIFKQIRSKSYKGIFYQQLSGDR